MVHSFIGAAKVLGLVVLSVGVLGACSHTSEPLLEDDVVETIDLMDEQAEERARNVDEGFRDSMNLSVLSNNISDGRVQVYDAQGNSAGSEVQNVAMVDNAVLVNEYVTIYPVDSMSKPAASVPATLVQPLAVAQDEIVVSTAHGHQMKVHFNHNSAMIRGDASAALDQIASAANGGAISVEGHASRRAIGGDPTRRIMGNLKISMTRAYNVARELVRRGVPADSIRLVGWGETRLPVSGADGEAARRVEVVPLAVSR